MYTGNDRYGDMTFDDLEELDQDEELLDQAEDVIRPLDFHRLENRDREISKEEMSEWEELLDEVLSEDDMDLAEGNL